MFDGMVRRSFGDFTGLHPNALQWKQAALGLGHGGLGLRSTPLHASAAFLASWASALQAGPELDVTFCPNEAKSCPEVVEALACFNSKLEPAANINLDDILSSKQHALSQRLDNAGWQEQLGNATPAGRATLLSEASVGGRAFLAAIPSGRTRMEPAAFISELRARLQIPDADTDAWCPLCDGVLDIHNYHAGMRVAGGERTQRHYVVRDIVCAWAHRAGLRPERERPGLLLPQSPEDSHRCHSARRRPADVFLPAFAAFCPRFRHHGSTAAGDPRPGEPETLGCCRGICPAQRSSPSKCRGVPRTRSLLYPHGC